MPLPEPVKMNEEGEDAKTAYYGFRVLRSGDVPQDDFQEPRVRGSRGRDRGGGSGSVAGNRNRLG